ncbi:hypothetical protein ASD11_03440 [Aeromicrobium sp. Root495]|uniref:hypothetical protein n=1 Tax=Aeromicrobium sp. Root495 TaxID=1736550 RepID=UPI0006F79E52|nr:hypothetical protein [Aeromicrobium sp. Root495]KQY58714.1 hypothetical protein ASD11_03440 [Aeromicrobium sp. Root495]
MKAGRIAPLIALTVTLAFTAGCGGPDDGKDEPAAKPSTAEASATPSATPLPKGLKTPPAFRQLTKEEQDAVDQATVALKDGSAAVEDLQSDPRAALADRKRTEQLLAAYYLPSYYDDFVSVIETFASQGQRLEGSSTLRWVAPVKVDLDASKPVIVLETCTTTEGLKIVGQAGKAKTKVIPTAISRTTFTTDGGGALLKTWKASSSKYIGDC